MNRIGLALLLSVGVWVESAVAQQLSITHFWVSANKDAPGTEGISHINVQPGSAETSSFYIWAKPAGDLNLVNWSLNVVSTNPEVIRLRQSTVYDPIIGSKVVNGQSKNVYRWELVGQPAAEDIITGTPTPGLIKGLQGYSISGEGGTVGVGIGYDNEHHYGQDMPIQGAWRIAEVSYEVGPNAVLGESANVFLQIGFQGLSHCALQEVAMCTSYSTQSSGALFGAASDKPLSAFYDEEHPEFSERQKNSETPEAIFVVSPGNSPGDFDGNGIYDGRDFLLWQRNPSIGKLADWQANYGRPPSTNALAVPEPRFFCLYFLCLCSLIFSHYRFVLA